MSEEAFVQDLTTRVTALEKKIPSVSPPTRSAQTLMACLDLNKRLEAVAVMLSSITDERERAAIKADLEKAFNDLYEFTFGMPRGYVLT